MIHLKIGHVGGLGGPGGFKTIQKGGGLRPPPLWMALKHPGAAQTPKTTDFQPNPKPPFAKPPSGNRRGWVFGSLLISALAAWSVDMKAKMFERRNMHDTLRGYLKQHGVAPLLAFTIHTQVVERI